MATLQRWNMSPGEELDLAVSLANDIGADDTLTGSTPTVSVWTLSGSTYTAATGFTVANPQVNASALTDADGKAIAVGTGVAFTLTAGAAGTYYVRVECDTADGRHPSTERVLIVAGAPAPS